MAEVLEDRPMEAASSQRLDDRIGVCFVIDRLGVAGTETSVLRLIKDLDHTKFRPCLALLDGSSSTSQRLEPENCPVIRLGVKRIKSPSGARSIWKLSQFLRKHGVEVLQMYFPDSTFFGFAAGRMAGVKHYIRNRRSLGYNLGKVDRFLGRLYSRSSVLTAANSEACRQAVIEQEAADPNSVVVIPNGVDLDRFAELAPPRSEFSAAKPPKIGMVANLRPVKDPQTLVKAAIELQHQFPNLELEIAGDGELRDSLMHQITAAGLQNQFRLVGRLDDIPKFVESLDVAVLSSTSEGLSNSIIEYMGAARPIVATNVGGNVELIEPEKTGLLVASGNTKQFVTCMRRMLEDREFAVRCGLAARNDALTNYALKRQTERFEAWWSDIARPTLTE